MLDRPSFEFDRCDTYMYFASNMLPANPVIVEVGSIHGAHGIKLWKKFCGELTMIAYEAGKENYSSLLTGLSIADVPIVARRSAVIGSDGVAEFFEFEEESSNSIYPRHKGEGRRLRRISEVKAVSLKTVIEDSGSDRVDLLFLNCEGAELLILEEILREQKVRNAFGQLCVSFHGGRIYPQSATASMVERMSEFFWVVEEQNDWPCHLFVNKNIDLKGE